MESSAPHLPTLSALSAPLADAAARVTTLTEVLRTLSVDCSYSGAPAPGGLPLAPVRSPCLTPGLAARRRRRSPHPPGMGADGRDAAGVQRTSRRVAAPGGKQCRGCAAPTPGCRGAQTGAKRPAAARVRLRCPAPASPLTCVRRPGVCLQVLLAALLLPLQHAQAAATEAATRGRCAALRCLPCILAAARRCCVAESLVLPAALDALSSAPWPVDPLLLCTLLTSLLAMQPQGGSQAGWDASRVREKLAASAGHSPRCGALCAQLALRWCRCLDADDDAREAWHQVAWTAVRAAAAWEASPSGDGNALASRDSARVLAVLCAVLRDELSAGAQSPGDDSHAHVALERLAVQHLQPGGGPSDVAAAWCVLLALPRHAGEPGLCDAMCHVDNSAMRAAMQCALVRGLGPTLVTAAWRWYSDSLPGPSTRRDVAARVLQHAAWVGSGERGVASDCDNVVATPAGIVAATLTRPARCHLLAALAACAAAGGEEPTALARSLLHCIPQLLAACGALPAADSATGASFALGSILASHAGAAHAAVTQAQTVLLPEHPDVGPSAAAAAVACICAVAGRSAGLNDEECAPVCSAVAVAAQRCPTVAFPLLLTALDMVPTTMHPSVRASVAAAAENAMSSVLIVKPRDPAADAAAAGDAAVDAVIADAADDKCLAWLAPALGCLLRGSSSLGAAAVRAVTSAQAAATCMALETHPERWPLLTQALQCVAVVVAHFMCSAVHGSAAMELLRGASGDAGEAQPVAMDVAVSALTLHAVLIDRDGSTAASLPRWFDDEALQRCLRSSVEALHAIPSNEDPSSPAAAVALLAGACAQRLRQRTEIRAVTVPLCAAHAELTHQRVASVDGLLLLVPETLAVDANQQLAALATRIAITALPPGFPHQPAQTLTRLASERLVMSTPSPQQPQARGRAAAPSSRRRTPASGGVTHRRDGGGASVTVAGATLAAVAQARGQGAASPGKPPSGGHSHQAVLSACRSGAMHLLGAAARAAAAADANEANGVLSGLCAVAMPPAMGLAVLQRTLNESHPGSGAVIFGCIKRALPVCPVGCAALVVAALMHWDDGGIAGQKSEQQHEAVRGHLACLDVLLSSQTATAEGLASAEPTQGQCLGRVVASLLVLALSRGSLGAPAAKADTSDSNRATAHQVAVRLLCGDAWNTRGLLASGSLVLQRPPRFAQGASSANGDDGEDDGATQPGAGAGEQAAAVEVPDDATVWDIGAMAISAAAAACEHQGGAIDDAAADAASEDVIIRFGGSAESQAAGIAAVLAHVGLCTQASRLPPRGLRAWLAALAAAAVALRRCHEAAKQRGGARWAPTPVQAMMHPSVCLALATSAAGALRDAADVVLRMPTPQLLPPTRPEQPGPNVSEPPPPAGGDGATPSAPSADDALVLSARAVHDEHGFVAACAGRDGNMSASDALRAAARALDEAAAAVVNAWAPALSAAAADADAHAPGEQQAGSSMRSRLQPAAAAVWRLGTGDSAISPAAVAAGVRRRRKKVQRASHAPPTALDPWILDKGPSAPAGGAAAAPAPDGAAPPAPPRPGGKRPKAGAAARAPKRVKLTGNAFIDACGEHDDDWDDLADFIVAKEGKDYGKVLARGGFLEAAGAGGARKRQAAPVEDDEEEEDEEEDGAEEESGADADVAGV